MNQRGTVKRVGSGVRRIAETGALSANQRAHISHRGQPILRLVRHFALAAVVAGLVLADHADRGRVGLAWAAASALVAYDLGVLRAVARNRRLHLLVPAGDLAAAGIALTIGCPVALAVTFAMCSLIATWGSVLVDDLRGLSGHLAAHKTVLDELGAVVWEEAAPTKSGTIAFAVGPAAETMLGWAPGRWAEPDFVDQITHPDDRGALSSTMLSLRAGGEADEVVVRCTDVHGDWHHVLFRVTGSTPSGELRGMFVDITKRVQAEAAWRRFAEITDLSPVGTVVLEQQVPGDPASFVIRFANPIAIAAMHRLAGRAVEPGRVTLRDLLPEAEASRAGGQLARVVETATPWSAERIEFPGDRNRYFDLWAHRLADGLVGLTLEEVTETVLGEQRLRRLALHDPLTGLPNRAMLRDRLERCIGTAEIRDATVSLLLMDLDHFKDVNDALGHDYGDRLIEAVAHRLREELRGHELVARLGGDEFAILVTDADPNAPERVARYALEAIERPLSVNGLDLQVSASIGIATVPLHAQHADGLVKAADVAMYEAKRTGVGFVVYSQAQERSSVRRLTLLGELRRAIADGELELWFQPAVDLRRGEVTKIEALVRWRHAHHGLMLPTEFIELAEMSGIIGPLTRWLTEETSAVAEELTQSGREVVIGANISVRNLYDTELLEFFDALPSMPGFRPGLLEFEITESELMADPMQAAVVLRRIRDRGISIVVDDFGTGYSSLAYLKNLPVTGLKIDRGFVSSMVSDSSDAAIVQSTIDLAHRLNLEVTAEGVTDQRTLSMLTDWGCDFAQGFWLSRPVSRSGIESAIVELNRRLRHVAPFSATERAHR